MLAKAPEYHVPVLGPEVVQHLISDPNGIYVDATLGGGGHAELILEQLGSEGRLIGVNRDPVAISVASQRLARFGSRFDHRQIPFWQLPDVLGSLGVERLKGALFDLGVSSRQIDDPERGFSYRQNGPLDMRMGPDAARTAERVFNEYSNSDLAKIFREYGDERAASRIAKSICRERETEWIRSTTQLAATPNVICPCGRTAGGAGDALVGLELASGKQLWTSRLPRRGLSKGARINRAATRMYAAWRE